MQIDALARRGEPRFSSFHAIGTTATVATVDPLAIGPAVALLRRDLDALDAAASRFRDDAEIVRLAEAGGERVTISPLLFELLTTAVDVARSTNGLVDPTIGAALVALGYDDDFAAICRDDPSSFRPVATPGWRRIALDQESCSARVPPGLLLDLGSSAKAWAADAAARRIADRLGTGVLVNLGGDISLAGGAPNGGWKIGIAPNHSTAPAATTLTVALSTGALASSGTSARAWQRGGESVHHIVNPKTGRPAPAIFELVTVAAANCVEANAASTAAIILGEDAPTYLEALGLASRLVRADGSVVTVSGWPDDPPQPRNFERACA